jgi:membrane peptidoglycan carboxypeptidase
VARSRPRPGVTLVKLFVVLFVAGVLFAGVLFPYVGGLGLVAKNEGAKFLDQPCNLTETPPPRKTTIYARDGQTPIATIFTQNRQPIPLSAMPKVLQEALVATEDRRFYQHQGVDMRSLLRSALQTTSGDTQGGSTLTMQYVKQERYYQADTIEQQQAAVDQNINRKIEDAKCALYIENVKKESKQQILENYLNIAFFGENSYSIQTAAQTYFGKNAKDLDLAESATLVGVLRAPGLYDPFVDRKKSQARRNLVIQNLIDQAKISVAAGHAAQAEPIKLATTKPQLAQSGCASANPAIRNVQFFCDYVTDWLVNKSRAVTNKQLTQGGLNIVTTLDPALQNATQKSLWGQLPATSPTTAIMPEVDPANGDVLAMATSKKYGNPDSATDNTHTVFPIFTNPTTGGASTYKLFTMLAALNAGATPDLRLGNNDPSSEYQKYNTRFCSSGKYSAQNSEAQQYNRNETMASAIAKSSNTYFVALEDQFFNQCDLKPAVQMAINLGLTSLTDPIQQGSALTKAQAIEDQAQATFTLGQTETSPLELTGAYAAIGHDGIFCPPAPILRITDMNGQQIDPKRTACAAKLSPQVARTAEQLLVPDTKGPVGTSVTSFSKYYGQGGADIAGKTGTNNGVDAHGKETGASSLWFVGVTPDLVATTALVNLTSSSKPLTGLPAVPDGSPVYGAYAAQMWVNALGPVLLAKPRWSLPGPGDVENGQPVPSVIGDDLPTAQAQLTQAGFKVSLVANGLPYCGSPQPFSLVGYEQPQIAVPGSTVTICLSNGNAPFIYVPPAPIIVPRPFRPAPSTAPHSSSAPSAAPTHHRPSPAPTRPHRSPSPPPRR